MSTCINYKDCKKNIIIVDKMRIVFDYNFCMLSKIMLWVIGRIDIIRCVFDDD